MSKLWRDVRFTFRVLWKSPALTAVALLSLALGIGANTAIFSLLNALLLRPLPVPHPEQLVSLSTTVADNRNDDDNFTWPMYQELQREQGVFSETFSWNGSSMGNFEVDGVHYSASLATASASYYRAMGMHPLLGRYFGGGDVATSQGVSNSVAVISYRTWRTWFHGDSKVLGRVIRVGTHPFTVIGVEPEGFSGMIIDGVSDITIPVFAQGVAGDHGSNMLSYTVLGRVKPGVTEAQARAGILSIWPHVLEATVPSDYSGERKARFLARKIKLESAATGISFLRKRFSYSLKILMGITGAVLLIACLNIANLSLARTAAQRHQVGVQAALGASMWDLVRPALLESVILSFSGASLGLFLAFWASRVLLKLAWTGFVAASVNASLDLRVLGFTTAVALIAAVLFGIVPALYAARTDPMEALKGQSRSVSGGATLFGKILLVTQIGLSLTLMLTALLFGRTLSALRTTDVGYRRDYFLTFQLFEQAGSKLPKSPAAYYKELTEKVRSVPGVESVSYSFDGPAGEYQDLRPVFPSLAESSVDAVTDTVAPDFFAVAGMHFLAGRDFNQTDSGHSPAIISQSLCERLFANQNPVGHAIYLGPHAHAQPLTIVGVVNSASLWKVSSVRPMAIYTMFEPKPDWDEPLMDVRTSVDPQTLKTSLERVIRSLGHHYSLRTMTVEERLNSRITVQQLTALLSEFFGGLALLIACVGLYGLMSFHVTRRTTELGIRSALGAERLQLVLMILREALLLAGAGCVLGVIISLATSRLIRSILFGVTPADPKILTIAVAIMMSVAAAAAIVPARRAAGVDAMTALRAE